MSLPILTTAEDIDSIVGYLRTKPTGVTTSDAKAIIKETADRRKVAAFTFWGIVAKEGDKLKLSTRGGELARKTKCREQILREILDSVVPYRSALEWFPTKNLTLSRMQTSLLTGTSTIRSHWARRTRTRSRIRPYVSLESRKPPDLGR